MKVIRKEMNRSVLLVLFSVLAFGCKQGLAAIPKEPLTPEAKQAVKRKHNIVIVADGGMDASVLARTVKGFQSRYGLTIKSGPKFSKTVGCRTEKRKQLKAECLLDTLYMMRNSEEADPNTVYIGVVTQDMWIANTPEWKWAFSMRLTEKKLGVVSIARMGKLEGRNSPGESRLRKMLLKNVAALAFGMNRSKDPESVLAKPILGHADLDLLGEKF